MKWIGQHIWDFISRFRSDVYLEGTETGTIASGGNLGLDANNKIVKAASGSGDLTITNAQDHRIVTSSGGTELNAEANFTLNSSTEVLELSSSTTSRPIFKLHNTNSDAEGPVMQFIKNSSSPAVDDELGHIQFLGDDSGGASSVLAEIIGYTQDKDDGSEEGKLTLKVASHDVEMQPGLSIFSGNSEDEVDVTIGNGATSLTTIAGTLTMGSTAFVNNSGVIQVATQGTIDHDSLANYVANEHLDWTTNTGTSIHRGNITTLDQIDGGVHFSSISPGIPVVKIENNHTTAGQSGELRFIKDAADVVDGEFLGQITFYGDNDAGTPEEIKYCEIVGTAKDVSDGAEGGLMYLNVASYDGEMRPGIEIFSGNGEDEVDVNIGGAATSLTTINGDLLLNQGKATISTRKFTVTGTTHFEYQGDVLYFGSGSTTQGDLCYLKENGEWGQADADGVATGDDADRDAMGMLAIALGTNPSNDGMFIRGTITMDYDMGDVGNPVYVSTVPGYMAFDISAWTTGDFVRVVGYCLDDTNGQIYFNPDNTWVEMA